MAPEVARATEGGGSSKVLGVETIRSGVMGDPGSLGMAIVAGHYTAHKTHDGAGNPRPGISNFDLSFIVVGVRMAYVWKDVKLWGADIDTRVAYALYVKPDLSFDVATPGGSMHRAGSASGTGDALIAPVSLGWHSDAYHQIASVEIYVPAGRFDATKLVNQSRGYYSVAPVYRFTWLPTGALEVSGNLVHLYNFKNPDTDYTSGRELVFDYGIGYAVAPGWQTGASGYVYRQLSDDKINGTVVGDGNRGQVVAIGPFIRYHGIPNWGITFKWQIEDHAKNRAQGNRFFLHIMRRLY